MKRALDIGGRQVRHDEGILPSPRRAAARQSKAPAELGLRLRHSVRGLRRRLPPPLDRLCHGPFLRPDRSVDCNLARASSSLIMAPIVPLFRAVARVDSLDAGAVD